MNLIKTLLLVAITITLAGVVQGKSVENYHPDTTKNKIEILKPVQQAADTSKTAEIDVLEVLLWQLLVDDKNLDLVRAKIMEDLQNQAKKLEAEFPEHKELIWEGLVGGGGYVGF